MFDLLDFIYDIDRYLMSSLMLRDALGVIFNICYIFRNIFTNKNVPKLI